MSVVNGSQQTDTGTAVVPVQIKYQLTQRQLQHSSNNACVRRHGEVDVQYPGL